MVAGAPGARAASLVVEERKAEPVPILHLVAEELIVRDPEAKFVTHRLAHHLTLLFPHSPIPAEIRQQLRLMRALLYKTAERQLQAEHLMSLQPPEHQPHQLIL